MAAQTDAAPAPPSDRAMAFLGVVAVVGIVALVSAAKPSHIDEDAEEFEEQHYRAAGFTSAAPEPNLFQDLFSFGATVAAVAVGIASLPAMIEEAKGLIE